MPLSVLRFKLYYIKNPFSNYIRVQVTEPRLGISWSRYRILTGLAHRKDKIYPPVIPLVIPLGIPLGIPSIRPIFPTCQHTTLEQSGEWGHGTASLQWQQEVLFRKPISLPDPSDFIINKFKTNSCTQCILVYKDIRTVVFFTCIILY